MDGDSFMLGLAAGLVAGSLMTIFGGWFECKMDASLIANRAKIEAYEDVKKMIDEMRENGK